MMNPYLQDIRKIFNISLPMVVSQITRLLNGFIATLMIARLGTVHLAAMALGQTYYLVFFLFFMGVFFSTSILTGHHFAAKRKSDIENTTAHAIIMSIVFAVPVMILMHFGSYLFLLFGQNPTVVHIAQQYIDALSWGILPIFISINLQQFLIGVSRPKILNLFSVLGLLINLTLFNLFIFGNFGFPALGVAGAGYSISIAATIVMFINILYIKKSKGLKQYQLFAGIKNFSMERLMTAVNIGWPIGLTMVLEMIAGMIFVFFIGIISTEALAAYQVVWQLSLIALMIPVACSQAIAVVTSQHLGANEQHFIRRSTLITWGLCLSLVMLFSLTFWVAPHAVVGLFLNREHHASALTFHIAMTMLMITGFIQLFDSTRFILNGCLRGLRDVRAPMFISITGFWVIGIPLAAIVVFVLKLGVITLWLSTLVGLLMIVYLLLKRVLDKTSAFQQ